MELLPAKVALVLVHGIDSGADAWDRMIALVRDDPDIHPWVQIENFVYPTGKLEWRPARTFPDIASVADSLRGRIERSLPAGMPIVFAAHSQGGLIVQRFLVQQLEAGRGVELRRVKSVLMFATPNLGSDYLEFLRRVARKLVDNAQEAELRLATREVVETLSKVTNRMVHAREVTATTVPIRFEAYAGLSDNIVKPHSARAVFGSGGSIPGDHSEIIRPTSRDSDAYQILRQALDPVVTESEKPITELRDPGTGRSGVTIGDTGRPLDIALDIANALARVETLQEFNGRNAFKQHFPPYIRNGLSFALGSTAVSDLGQLVRACIVYEDDGRAQLIEAITSWLEQREPAVQRALELIRRVWPEGLRKGDSHPPA
ncbi:esterase/lipase family protein [Nocardia noduli]|uniref:esterase/lipase family protein n=1 Tax=Nocardia noduli TaxID=2815722 RepID=UPI001C23378F|nr:hypothetical protein [Nocardia noduli]